MDLITLLSEKRSVIVKRWIAVALESYPSDTAGFLKNHRNRFTNPVGYSLSQGLETILDGLIRSSAFETITPALDSIVRVTAVQGLTPAQALGFLFRLKEIVREVIGEIAGSCSDELRALDSRIDALVLLAFDIYMQCREKIYDLKATESRNMTFRLLQRAKIITGDKPE